MKMAKASEHDLESAMRLSGILDAISGSWPTVPSEVESVKEGEDAEQFNRDDAEQCQRVLGCILDLINTFSLMRVVYGAAVMIDPRNCCVDPDSDMLEHHPHTKAGMAMSTRTGTTTSRTANTWTITLTFATEAEAMAAYQALPQPVQREQQEAAAC